MVSLVESGGVSFGKNCCSILNAIADGVYITDLSRTITFWNKGAEALTGYSASEVVGKSCKDNILKHINDEGSCLCLSTCPLADTLIDGNMREADVFLHHKEGFKVSVTIKISPLFDASGRIKGAVEIFSDNSQKHSALELVNRLTQENLIDELTGVGNRRNIGITLQARIDELKRYGWVSAIALYDVDNFKAVNDEHGHVVGDSVLKVISRTIKNSLRSFDFVGRYGGDEFILCLPNIQSKNYLLQLIERIRMLVDGSSIDTDLGKINVTVSIGATLLLQDDTADTALKRADKLLYQSKQAGKNRASIG